MEGFPEQEASSLVIVVDLHFGKSILQNDPKTAINCLESIISFANAHLIMNANNKLAVLSCNASSSEFLYPSIESESQTVRQQDGQYELFTLVEKAIRRSISKILMQCDAATTNRESLLSGALSRALCYIHRQDRERGSRAEKLNSRILLISASGDSASQYMSYMNVFFTAQKQNVLLDVCSLGPESGLLQQGCDITGGQYLQVPQIQGLLQYLLWVFLPEPPLRTKLVLPPPVKVDYRAACFCHRELVDIGYVCSVCLSIFCKFSPICTTCHTVFKTPGTLSLKTKKKKPRAS